MKTQPVNLTTHFIDNLPLPVGRVEYTDKAVTNLKLRLSGNTKTWAVLKRVDGKLIRHTLGKYPEIGPKKAREAANLLLGQLVLGTYKTKKQTRIQSRTLRQTFEGYLEQRGDKLKPSTVTSYRNDFKLTFSDWADRPLTDLKADAVEAIHAYRSKASKSRADGAMRLLRAIFNYADDQLGDDFVLAIPTKRLSRQKLWNRVPRKDRSIKLKAVPGFIKAVRSVPDSEKTADATLLLLFTGCRLNEILRLAWEDIDFQEATFRLNDNKSKRPVTLPLNSESLAIIQKRLCEREPDDVYVFQYGPTHLKSLGKVFVRSKQDFSAHDLRRTFMTTADGIGVGKYLLKRLVNHSNNSGDVTDGYITNDLDLMMDASNRIAQALVRGSK